MKNLHPWKARLAVGFVMLALAFIGMIVTDIHAGAGWTYWVWVIPVYAILALWLSWFIRRDAETINPITIWHEVLHWVGLIAAVFLVVYFVHLGTMSRFVAGLFNLTLLSLAVFLAGVYIETTFIFVGIVLGVFALFSATIIQYLYAVILPIFIGCALVLGIWLWLSHHKKPQ